MSPRRRLILTRDADAASNGALLLSALDDCRVRTLEAIADVEQDELDWTCPAVSRSTIGSLLYHIAAIELDWLCSDILGDAFPAGFRTWFPADVRDARGHLAVVVGERLDRYVARLEYVRSMLLPAIRDMGDADLTRLRRREAYDVTAEWAVCHLMQHEAEHRGQIAVLRGRFAEARPS